MEVSGLRNGNRAGTADSAYAKNDVVEEVAEVELEAGEKKNNAQLRVELAQRVLRSSMYSISSYSTQISNRSLS